MRAASPNARRALEKRPCGNSHCCQPSLLARLPWAAETKQRCAIQPMLGLRERKLANATDAAKEQARHRPKHAPARTNGSTDNKFTNLRACKHISNKQCIHSAIDSAGCHQLAKSNCLPHGTVKQSSPWMKLVSDKSKVSSRDHCRSDPVRVQSTLGIPPEARRVQSP